MCMYVYIYDVHICIYIDVYIHVCMHTYMHMINYGTGTGAEREHILKNTTDWSGAHFPGIVPGGSCV